MKQLPALDRPVTEFLSQAAITLKAHHTIEQALSELRLSAQNKTLPTAATGVSAGGEPTGGVSQAADAQITYFYVLNAQDQLVGVLPARQLILGAATARIGDLMMRTVIALADKETLADALELFATHRLLAVPVVDRNQHFLGIVELSLYTEEVFNLAQHRQLNEVFQLMGLRLEDHKQSIYNGFQMRMPWLLANITGGLICAALGSLFEAVVAEVVIIALFIPLILTLAESVAVQSMTLAIEQAVMRQTFPGQMRKEVLTSLLIGLCTGALVGLVSLAWRGPLAATFTISGSVTAAILIASLLGRVVPKIIHLFKLNPRIASGPITLAVVDVFTITLYLSMATLALGK